MNENIETALHLLTAKGFDTKALWLAHNARLHDDGKREPTEHDEKWATRAAEPTPIAEHLMEEHVSMFRITLDDGRQVFIKQTTIDPEILTAANCFPDRQYTLSPGQREVLRERYGLQLSKVMIVTNVEMFPGTNIIASFRLEAGRHIDPRNKGAVLVKAVVRPAADFFEAGAKREKEAEERREEQRANGKKPSTVRRDPTPTLDALLASLDL